MEELKIKINKILAWDIPHAQIEHREEAIKHILELPELQAIQVEAKVKVNFAEEDLEIIKELLVGNKDELKKHIFYKRNEEYCKNRLIKIEEIISKISA